MISLVKPTLSSPTKGRRRWATNSTFTPQVLGETEKALNAILYRQLTATGLTEHQWITLRLTVAAGGEIPRGQLVGRLAGALKIGAADAETRVGELETAGLLRVFRRGCESP